MIKYQFLFIISFKIMELLYTPFTIDYSYLLLQLQCKFQLQIRNELPKLYSGNIVLEFSSKVPGSHFTPLGSSLQILPVQWRGSRHPGLSFTLFKLGHPWLTLTRRWPWPMANGHHHGYGHSERQRAELCRFDWILRSHNVTFTSMNHHRTQWVRNNPTDRSGLHGN